MKRFNVQYPMSNIQRSSEQPRRGQSNILMFCLLMGLSAAVAKAEQANARASFDAGLQAFAASNWPAASNAFLAAAAAAPVMNEGGKLQNALSAGIVDLTIPL